MIKFWSYKEEYKKYNKSILNTINKTISSGNIFFGDQLKTFEKNFVKKYKAKYGVAVGSGTDALLLALKTLNLKTGDEVITAANTAIPTISAIINAGGKPRLVDIGEDYLIDTKKIQKEINSKTKAIIPVHLYGQMCDMDEITRIAKINRITIIEDCAQSQGAKYKNKFSGTFGKFGCFSFYPTKILGAYGDGGFIFTSDFKAYKQIMRLRFYGIETVEKNKFKNKYYANENGFNSRMDEIQSSILNFKLNKTDYFIRRRIDLTKFYMRALSKTNLKLPKENNNCKHVYHLFTVFHPKGREIIKKLLNLNIQTRKIYPYPIHKMKAYSKIIKNKKYLKNSEAKSKGIFCLPLYPELKNKELKKICNSLIDVLKKI
jgi:dTDP-3-amino-2,3,6-trideoxy-4-keto-D-glucose/dTDP-3-amino-3,4,6-trideoxy-alpha-D-glucose/dTDP-2,6-dideoxy-D-kanosamine transaminase|tara:strand:- start:48 stop:1172 length:1125 start_codon:yes stop_codon:yes gene_type:complete